MDPMNHQHISHGRANVTHHTLDLPKSRADSFPIAEIELMLKEMRSRSDVLLSLSPSSHRLKKSAWEEVTAIMGIYFPRRTPEQVKKKWENLLTKTRRKVRQNLINSSSWSKINDMVWKFLVENREARYLFGPGRFSRANELSHLFGVGIQADHGIQMKTDTTVETWSALNSIEYSMSAAAADDNDAKSAGTSSETNNDDSESRKGSSDSIPLAADQTHPFVTLPPLRYLSGPIQEEVLQMWRKEHNMRMKVLELQHEAALIQLDLLNAQMQKK